MASTASNKIFLRLAGIAGLIIVALAVSACALSEANSEEPSYRIVAYAGGDMDYWSMDVEKLTHVNFAFAHINDDGEIYFRDEAEAGARLAQLQALKARNPDLKLLVSVGGWGADGFSDAALTEESREIFSRSAVDMIKRYGLDGIDIDWEFPGQPGPGIKYREEDKQNFTAMMRSLREHIDALSDERGLEGDDRYLLTIASNDNQRFFDHTEMDEVHPHLDFVNAMTYDMASVGSSIAAHHAGLYQSGPDGPSRTAASSIQIHLDAGIPAHKIVLGVAFFGRGWTVANRKNNGLLQPVDEWYGFIQYDELVDEYIDKNGFERRWDDEAKSPYVWNPESRVFISYDDPESLRHKTEFIRERGLGGVMYWHHAYDPSQELLDVLYEGLR